MELRPEELKEWAEGMAIRIRYGMTTMRDEEMFRQIMDDLIGNAELRPPSGEAAKVAP